ncbi:MAG: hypothetical protein ACU84Q_17490, partial [Gammaproteobacteria bacterium]
YGSVLGDFASVPDVVVPSGTLTFSGADQGMFYRVANGPLTGTSPAIPEESPVVVLPEDNEEPDLSEVIALESNSDLLESELVEESNPSAEQEEDKEKKEYKVCTG